MTSSLTQKGSNVACLAAQLEKRRVLLFLPQLPNSETLCQQVETVGYESNPALSALEPVKKRNNKQTKNYFQQKWSNFVKLTFCCVIFLIVEQHLVTWKQPILNV